MYYSKKKCSICGETDNENFSFHKLPRNAEKKKLWLQSLRMSYSSNILICSQHFLPNDYIDLNARSFGGKLRLLPSAVPSLFITTECIQHPSTSGDFLFPIKENVPLMQRSCSTCSSSENKKHSPDVLKKIRRLRNELARKKIAVAAKNKSLGILRKKRARFMKKTSSLQDLVKHLQNKKLISEEATTMISAHVPDSNNLLNRKRDSRVKFSPELRKFAITLQFYSAKAYRYVRKIWGNLLPHPTTLKKWYSVVDGKPGFTKEALRAIAMKAKNSLVLCNIVIDEMYIREQEIFDGNRFYGGVDLGTGLSHNNDSVSMAKAALVFMAVSLNGNWKVPVGYFLINGLGGEERANLLLKCLELMHETGAKVYSITFDGEPVNLNMCTSLGANFDINSPHFQPWFLNPITGGKIYTFWDPCHMVKLIRNTLGDWGIILDSDNNEISWKYIKALNDIQKKEGLVAATKLTNKHINYNDNRMSVRLAVQTLSASVYNALRFVEALDIPDFKGSYPTAVFCNMFNIFDILNVRNNFGKDQCKMSLRQDTIEDLKKITESFEQYIQGLKDQFGTPILETKRKTGFVGLIICFRNMFELYKDIHLEGQQYLLTFKLSQDYIETYYEAKEDSIQIQTRDNLRLHTKDCWFGMS